MNKQKIKKSKKYRTLDYIEKLFKIIPLVFIFILTIVSLFITYFILDSKEKRDIDLLKQNKELHFQFERKEELQNFVLDVSKNIEDDLEVFKRKIKKNTYQIIGNLGLLSKEKNDFSNLNNFLSEHEKNSNYKVTLFEKNSLKILHGANNIEYLEKLIFGKISLTYEEKALQYILSQGENNLQIWKNDLKGTLRFSFFDILKIDEKEYFIGTFSNVKNINMITKKNIIDEIMSENNKNYQVWFLDLISKQSFNYYGNHEFVHANDIIDDQSKKFEILNYYHFSEEENKNFEKQVFYNSLFNYILVLDSNLTTTYSTDKIEDKYDKLFISISAYIFIVSVIITLFSFLFSNFIKNILDRYNRKLEKRTDSLMHWKKRFELAIIASNDGLWDIDFSTNKIYFSSKWLEIAGYEKGEVSTVSDWFNLIHNEDKDKVDRLFDKIATNKSKTFICEYRLKTKFEGYKWILARGRIFEEKKTNLKRMLMMSMDIDKSKRMKKELLDIELLVEDGKIVIFKLNNDEQLSVKYISSSIKNYGYVKQTFESKNMNFVDLIHKEDLNIVKVAFQAATKKDLKDLSFVCRFLNASDEIRWISCRAILIKNHSGDVINFYGYLNDITKIKVSQEELKVKVEEEVSKNRDKDKLLIQQSKLASMGEMIGSIAHQWRQPLNNVSLILQFLRDNYSNKDIEIEKVDKYFTRAHTQINYMSDTIDDFKNFYKPSKSVNEFNLKNAIENSLKIIKVELQSEKIEVKIDSDDIVLVNYENELKQSLLNIFSNAKDVIISKREIKSFHSFIEISAKKKDDMVIIEISNNGGSIPIDIIDKIFQPYFTTKFETQGTGIGLYMTKTIIETNMKGRIEVMNIEDGVKFIISLPLLLNKKEK